ncbi:hypothetical protein KCP77_24935 (plasmid) [Salmonella enterica subsp. enterica]|nr:hypothetical protein KCP77_24935 [Salmonella enterica subsp. enterica]
MKGTANSCSPRRTANCAPTSCWSPPAAPTQLALDATGVTLTARRYRHRPRHGTSVEHIYAAGDFASADFKSMWRQRPALAPRSTRDRR